MTLPRTRFRPFRHDRRLSPTTGSSPAPDRPIQAPGHPAQAPNRSTHTPARPPQPPGRPAQAPRRQAGASERPVGSRSPDLGRRPDVSAATTSSDRRSGRILVVTAVDAESRAVLAGLGDRGAALDWSAPTRSGSAVDVIVAGVGMAAAAARTATALAWADASGRPYQLILSMGIGGAFAGRAPIGAITVGTASVAADLGATGPDGFIPVEELGFGRNRLGTDPGLAEAFAGAIFGEILTVNTVTGTAERAAELAHAHPDAVVEAMEGFGVATAAEGTPFGEIRTISNLVGPRDRDAWRIGDALAALSRAAAIVGTLDR